VAETILSYVAPDPTTADAVNEAGTALYRRITKLQKTIKAEQAIVRDANHLQALKLLAVQVDRVLEDWRAADNITDDFDVVNQAFVLIGATLDTLISNYQQSRLQFVNETKGAADDTRRMEQPPVSKPGLMDRARRRGRAILDSFASGRNGGSHSKSN